MWLACAACSLCYRSPAGTQMHITAPLLDIYASPPSTSKTSMSPPCVIVPGGGGSQFRYPAALQSLESSSAGLLAPGGGLASAAGLASSWVGPLCDLRDRPLVTRGSPSELTAYRDFVADCLSRALAASCCPAWRDSGLPDFLVRALSLCAAGKSSAARQAGVELIGFARLAQALKMQSAGAMVDSNAIIAHPDMTFQPGSVAAQEPAGRGPSTAGEFKVPAARSSPERQQQQQQQQQELVTDEQQPQTPLPSPPAAVAAPGPRCHSAPKRRATPQVLAAAPPLLSSAAAPLVSGSHGAVAYCDEQLLSTWCPISGKRQKLSPPPRGNSSGNDGNGTSSSSDDESNSQGSHRSTALDAGLTLPSQQPPQTPSSPSLLRSDSSSSDSSSSVLRQPASSSTPTQQQQQPDPLPLSRPPLPPPKLLSVASPPAGAAAADERRGSSTTTTSNSSSTKSAAAAAAAAAAVERVTQLMHQDPASQPAACALLFNAHGTQLPIDTWRGVVRHHAGGRAVELCSAALQVPALFLEELPAALSAADVRHRRSVSLGRHVVCRATLGPLTEHQLASLAAMAAAQLVAVCRLQTAELHLVPYFDNRNLVRMVGFLKVLQQ